MPLDQAVALRSSRLLALREDLARIWPVAPAAITLEIGCGHGHFLTAYATAHPAETCLGIDLLKDRIGRATRKAVRAGLTNLAFLQAEAALLLEALPPAVQLATVFVLFPDPWPKRRHHKNRLMQPEFLSALAAKAAPNASLHFRTDYEPYFAAATATLQEHPDWRVSTVPWPFEHDTVFQTRAPAYQSCTAIRHLPDIRASL